MVRHAAYAHRTGEPGNGAELHRPVVAGSTPILLGIERKADEHSTIRRRRHRSRSGGSVHRRAPGAPRLPHPGSRTADKVGGRASTDDIDGFKVNNGAIVIEVGGITQQTCEEVGAPFDIREPKPPLLYRIGGKDVDVTGGGWGFLLSKLTRQGAKLVKGIGAARNDSGLPEDQISTADWVSRYTKNEGVHGIFRNMCASIFAVGSEDLPARVFLTYFTRKSAFKRFGFHPEGTIGLWRGLATPIESHGGQVWLSTPAVKIVSDGATVTGVKVVRRRDGQRGRAGRGQRHRPAATMKLLGEENVPAATRTW